MNLRTQFQELLILPVLIALALVAYITQDRARRRRSSTGTDTRPTPPWSQTLPLCEGLSASQSSRGHLRRCQCNEGYPFTPYAVTPNVVTPASPEAATAASAHDVLVALFPSQQADLDAKYAASLAPDSRRYRWNPTVSLSASTAAGIPIPGQRWSRRDSALLATGSGPGVWIPHPPGFLAAQAPEVA